MENCIFCKIVAGEIPSKKVYEDEKVLAFYDINPAAPVHILIIPKEHIKWALDIDESNASIVAHIACVAAKIAKELGLSSYRLQTNCGEDAGQTVFHLHFHLLSGKVLSNEV